MSALAPFLSRTRIAYFTMEVALRAEMRTYAGGLGVLAGDTVRSAADLALPVVFVALVSRAGYFRQSIDEEGRQQEQPDWWRPEDWCQPLDAMVAVAIEARRVWVRPWLYVQTSPQSGRSVPVLLLDTDLDQNSEDDRRITHHLYGGDEAYRLKQEAVLGIGGMRLLHALGFDIRTYHLNEGHAALLALELLDRSRPAARDDAAQAPCDAAAVRERCVFTTHTPVTAAQDRFGYGVFERLLPDLAALPELRTLAGPDDVNMTRLALALAGWVNGVSMRHARTTQNMYPGRRIHAVTNGVHVGTWTHPCFAALYQAHWPHWQHEPELLARAAVLPDDELWRCHAVAKAELIERVRRLSGRPFDAGLPIIVIARRMTGYKRPLLLFSDLQRLAAIARQHPFQLILAGKAHPRDDSGKDAIHALHGLLRTLPPGIDAVFLPNHDLDLAKALVAGADLWLNTPLPPMEASGTSGMKAALNGVLNASVLDGWWLEACQHGVNGWAIGGDGEPSAGAADADALYRLLADEVLPAWSRDRPRWGAMMKEGIRSIASYFNSQRMMRRYASEVYLR